MQLRLARLDVLRPAFGFSWGLRSISVEVVNNVGLGRETGAG